MRRINLDGIIGSCFAVPPAAPLLHATSATSNSINVQWKNRDDGGAPIRGYILHYKRESGEWEEMKVSHKINSFVLSRLWCGNDYQMYLTAYNRIGMGSPSEIVKATTNGSKPENSPSNGDKFVTVNVSWITLHLSMWNDGGCPITHFELEYRKNGEDIWTLVSNNIEVSTRPIYFVFPFQPFDPIRPTGQPNIRDGSEYFAPINSWYYSGRSSLYVRLR